MLHKLSIRNYALIRELDLDLGKGLCIVTGETGAGKSILLGALSLILGQRADTRVLYDKDQKCIVEGKFDISKYGLEPFFEKHDLDYEEGITLIRREIAANGKSRAFVNDTPVNLNTLRELSNKLVNHHAQHETLDLFNTQFYLSAVDAFANNSEHLEAYQQKYKPYIQDLRKLEEIMNQNAQDKQDTDFLEFQLNELTEARIQPNEQAELEKEMGILTHAETIKSTLSQVMQLLDANEHGITERLREVKNSLDTIRELSPELDKLQSRVESSRIELSDVANELNTIAATTTMDPERIQQAQDRLDLLYRLEQKHRVQTSAELLEVKEALEAKLGSFMQLDEELERLKSSVDQGFSDLEPLLLTLSKNRQAQVPEFEREVNKLLGELGMPMASLNIQIRDMSNGEFNAQGKDNIQFLFSANKGSESRNITQVASGGELSRLMLVIKSLIARKLSMPTLIFDEIDSGISGEIAGKVGLLLGELSSTHQVICITHRPQIAGMGNSHYYVYKETQNDQTVTRVKVLDEADRITEIAKMLSGEDPSQAALDNAKELLVKA